MADVHLRHNQFGSNKRGEHFFNSFVSAIRAAHKAGVRAIFNSGDLLDKNRQRTGNVHQLIQADLLLKELGMSMYTITGNHDMDFPTWLDTLFPTNNAETNGIIPVDNKILEIIPGVLSVGGLHGHDSAMYVEQLEKTDHLPDIVLWHGAVGGFMSFEIPGSKNWEEVLAASKKPKAHLLGDLHVHKYFEKDGVFIGYPGSTDMCSITEEPNKKLGTFIYDTVSNTLTMSDPIPFDSTPVINVDLTNMDPKKIPLLHTTLQADIGSNDFTLVRLVYDQESIKEANMLAAVLPADKCIIRRKLLSEVGQAIQAETGSYTSVVPKDLVPKYFEEGDPMFEVASQLAVKGSDPSIIIEHYINQHAPEGIRAL